MKRVLILLAISFALFYPPALNAAEVGAGGNCGPNPLATDHTAPCIKDYCCELPPGADPKDPRLNTLYKCRLNPVCAAFGKVTPPSPVAEFLKNEPTGAGAISQFLSNFIALLFGIAAIVLIFMIIWGALDWTTSGGDKEKLAGAQKRIVHAIIGMILFAVAFAALAILGRFTGFTLFRGQNYTRLIKDTAGNPEYAVCKDGQMKDTRGKNPDEVCR